MDGFLEAPCGDGVMRGLEERDTESQGSTSSLGWALSLDSMFLKQHHIHFIQMLPEMALLILIILYKVILKYPQGE